MPVVYVSQPDAVLSKTYEAFTLALRQEDGSWKKHSIPAQTVEQVVLIGNPQVTGDAMVYALELGIPVHYLSVFGKYLGGALPGYSRNGALRLAQYQLHCDAAKRLDLVKSIVAAKIQNQHTVLYRQNIKDNPLKANKKLVAEKQTLNEVMGIEGLAAKNYFGAWASMLKEPWCFPGRNRRPPTDPVNSLLSFGYGLLRVQVTTGVHVTGLDPYIGYLHAVSRGQPAMVLDLMEEFRPLVTDSLVLSVLNRREFEPADFTESLGAYRLSEGSLKRFLKAFDRKMNDEFNHPVFGYRCTYRRAIELQARLLGRHLQEGVAYKPLVLR